MPKSRCSPRAATRARDTISSVVSTTGTCASAVWIVTGTVRNVGPASIITTLPPETPQRSAMNSVWPG
jgi:hypothetical protein